MERYATSRESIMGKAGMWAMLGGVCWMLGLIFAVIGVIGEATDSTIGLEPISWFLLSIAAFVASVSWYLGWVLAAYLHTKEAINKE